VGAPNQVGEFFGAFHWGEVSDAVNRAQGDVGEEVVESI
jgi:hypothetical protein